LAVWSRAASARQRASADLQIWWQFGLGPRWKNHAMLIGGGLQQRRRTRLLGPSGVCVGVVVAAVFSVAHSAAAAPSCLQSLRDRYEPGDEVTVVGYGCVREASGSGAGENLVVFGYLHVMPDPCAGVDPTMSCNPWGLFSEGPPVEPGIGVPLGQVSLEESPHPLRGLRASLTFRIPIDLAPGTYYIQTCGEPCVVDERAYPTWPWPLYIGVDPPTGEPRVHHWPLDDPAIDLLPGDALLLGPDGDEVTAAELRAEAANNGDRSERVETAPAPADEPRDDHTRLTLWIAAAALVLAAGWVVFRLGRPRKRIHPGP
jgi:hypothetical protein